MLKSFSVVLFVTAMSGAANAQVELPLSKIAFYSLPVGTVLMFDSLT